MQPYKALSPEYIRGFFCGSTLKEAEERKQRFTKMAITSVRYKEEYLHSDLGPDGNFCLLSNGEVIELPPEDEENICIATELLFVIG